jgi:hypothetical protein
MPEPRLTLNLLPDVFAICQLNRDAALPAWALEGEFFSVTRTADELSIVCPQTLVPEGVKCEKGWRGLRVAGTLDFSLTGILASLAATLAEAQISIFAIATFDTDYLLVKADKLENAIEVLTSAGHRVTI